MDHIPDTGDVARYERLIAGFSTDGYAVVDDWLDRSTVRALAERIDALQRSAALRPANIGRGFARTMGHDLRGDRIAWLEPAGSDAVERHVLHDLDAFRLHLNATCFTGLTGQEFHYALYPPGSRYIKHLDRFRDDDARRFSFVVYLNERWTAGDGGQLRLHRPQGIEDILPLAGRAVFFASDVLPHEVLVAHRRRRSVVGWFRTDRPTTGI